jgi:GH15 family glucan-1,4-alpha-glucosidase
MNRYEPDQKLVLGHDLSTLQQLEDVGRTFSDDGWAQLVEQIVAHHGATYIRERLWVNPPIPYNDLLHILMIARRIKAAGLGTPWGERNGDQDSGGCHLVWERVMYEFSSALIVAGDTVGPKRALLWAFTKQQQTGGLFPQNSYIDGTPYFSGIQMDEQAFPIMLAWKLGITDKQDYLQHIKPTADLIVKSGGVTGQERWEENGGYSPSTLAAEISGLVCAAGIARINGDTASQ